LLSVCAILQFVFKLITPLNGYYSFQMTPLIEQIRGKKFL
jgi:hypothetical protein